MKSNTTPARVDGTLDPLLADLRQARMLMEAAWHRFPDSQPANARTFTNWIRAISAIGVTITEIADIAANAGRTFDAPKETP